MRVYFLEQGWEDYRHWQATDLDTLNKVNELIEAVRRTPFSGIGKPEALKGDFSGWWSRRITQEHRLVYRVEGKAGTDQRIIIAQCRYHY
ncbi:Txe/YoeB family addiction module toxin [Roseomonas sp. USHLN139]|uniref:Txe/YoeB family addiction module toxin n=1 Tax=Roseomonas sp. USHLN139 TaxID=3081298 RepID=UPI003B0170D9